MATIHLSKEAKRGCGYRKPGGLYLVAPEAMRPCVGLPFPIDYPESRGFQWIENAVEYWNERVQCSACILCPFKIHDRVGLIWIGEGFYNTEDEFLAEVKMQGVSRRIPFIPKDFQVGKTEVWLAHHTAFHGQPGVFSAFVPKYIEYIVTGEETEEELDEMEERGLRLVKVEYVEEEEEENASRIKTHRVEGESARSLMCRLIYEQEMTDAEIIRELKRVFPTKSTRVKEIDKERELMNKGKREHLGYEKPKKGYGWEPVVKDVPVGKKKVKTPKTKAKRPEMIKQKRTR